MRKIRTHKELYTWRSKHSTQYFRLFLNITNYYSLGQQKISSRMILVLICTLWKNYWSSSWGEDLSIITFILPTTYSSTKCELLLKTKKIDKTYYYYFQTVRRLLGLICCSSKEPFSRKIYRKYSHCFPLI